MQLGARSCNTAVTNKAVCDVVQMCKLWFELIKACMGLRNADCWQMFDRNTYM
jgi:hypothetical protein